jgi:DNA processing protein
LLSYFLPDKQKGRGLILENALAKDIADERLVRSELPYWLAFHRLGRGAMHSRKLVLLYEHFGSMKKAWEATASDLRQVLWLTPEGATNLINRKQGVDPDELHESVKKSGVKAYSFYDSQYPPQLREIIDAPLVLFVLGRYSVEDLSQAVGVVGTRKPTTYGRGLAKDTGRGLAKSGATVVSGMAVGIDSLAHWGAIECGGKTIAVLGCGVDHCYPSSNRPLYEKLCSGTNGAVMSEYFPGTKPEPYRFPQRNRIISGITQALVVVEAGVTSGSLITAKLAFEQNREVFAIPGRVDSPASEGTNQLIARNQAHLITNYGDVLTEMSWVSGPIIDGETHSMVELFGREKEIYDLIALEPIQFDVLSERLGMSAHELSASLTMLELAGVVTRLPGDWYERHKSSFQAQRQKIF